MTFASLKAAIGARTTQPTPAGMMGLPMNLVKKVLYALTRELRFGAAATASDTLGDRRQPLMAIAEQQPLYRQGDVLLCRIGDSAADLSTADTVTIAQGEASGHSHRIYGALAAPTPTEDQPRSVGNAPDNWLIDVPAPGARLRHVRRDGSDTGEHDTIVLPAGRYLVTRQREYDPEGERRVQD
jgi:hypothetical protein